MYFNEWKMLRIQQKIFLNVLTIRVIIVVNIYEMIYSNYYEENSKVK